MDTNFGIFNILVSYIQFITNSTYIVLTLVGFKTGIIKEKSYDKRIINLIREGGPIYIKYAQIYASRKIEDNFHLLKGIKLLEDNVEILENEKRYEINYLNSLDKLKVINEKALGSGSIASVYQIQYKNKKSVAKIVHPNVIYKINRGEIILKTQIKIFGLFNRHFKRANRFIDFRGMKESIYEQTNMEIEKNSTIKFFDIFNDDPIVKIPNIYSYSKSCLIMEKVSGLNYRNFLNEFPDYDFETISALYYCVSKMIKNKFCHIDLHWGNIFFNITDNDTVKITLLDFGIVKEISELEYNSLIKIFDLKSSKEIRENNICKLFWLMSKKDYKYEDFNAKLNDYIKKNKRSLKFIMDFFYENNIFISHKDSLFLNSIGLILQLIEDKRDENGFIPFLEGYMLDNEI